MSDDEGAPAPKKVKISEPLPECPYGAKCYRKNPDHLKAYAHKTEDAKIGKAIAVDASKLPLCPFGATCYRKNLLHFAEYSHAFDGAGPSAVPDDSGSDTDPCESEPEDEKKNGARASGNKLKYGLTTFLKKSYSQMSDSERRTVIQKAGEAKKALESELEQTRKQVQEKERELSRLQEQVNTGLLLMDGELEALKGDKIKYFPLVAEREYREGSPAQVHFRLAESQFYRLLSGGAANQYRVTKVEYVVNPELHKQFKEARESLKEKRGEESSYPVLGFHGTKMENIKLICETGFKVPGEAGFQHRTDSGYYGRGVYFSEYPDYSMGYIQGATKLLLSQVLLGKTYQCMSLIQGKPLVKGHDSHISPNKKELIIFNAAQMLPCYVVHYKAGVQEFQYKSPNRKQTMVKTDLKKLYWKAAKARKSTTLTGLVAHVYGNDLCADKDEIQALVNKHSPTTGLVVGTSNTVLVITTPKEMKSPKRDPAIDNWKTSGATFVREEYLYECIIQKQKLEPDEYELEEE